jgi:prenylcysteine oxidase/farnesylcysteine lyase
VTTYYNTAVTEIVVNKEGVTLITADGKSQDYDTVVLATPLELSGIAIQDKTGEAKIPELRKMQRVFVTLVSGKLSNTHFGLPPSATCPSTLFVKSNVGLQYNSIGITGIDGEGNRLYKIFSERRLSAELLPQLFSTVNATKEFIWEGAFPKLEPKASVNPWSDFTLAPGKLYYTSAIESAVSSIEVSAVAGRNVAQLIIQDSEVING